MEGVQKVRLLTIRVLKLRYDLIDRPGVLGNYYGVVE